MGNTRAANKRTPVRRWYRHLLREWTVESRRAILPAFAQPNVASWRDDQLTAAWLGHATALINFFGFVIITDPVLFPRIGIRLPGLTIGPKRLTAPALKLRELPQIHLVLLSHAHFDHFDMGTLHRLNGSADVITAARTADLLRWTRFRDKKELRWGEEKVIRRENGELRVRAFPVKHWGAR
ncbi:MAG: MBL fold metallo-hydrolase, partial [Chthoniobacterales bacterium]